MPSKAPKKWATRIAEAERRGYFSKEDAALADAWTTCAVGERNDYELHVPAFMSSLYRVGTTFGFVVERSADVENWRRMDQPRRTSERRARYVQSAKRLYEWINAKMSEQTAQQQATGERI